MNLGFHNAEEALAILRDEIKELQDRVSDLQTQEVLLITHLSTLQQDRFAKGKPRLATLPLEIFSKIASILRTASCPACGNDFCSICRRYNPTIFEPLTRVSKNLRRLTEPFLYHGISLTSNGQNWPSTRADLLVRTLEDRPELREMIRILEISETSHRDFELLALCTHLVSLNAPGVRQALKASPTLKTLKLRDPEFVSIVMDVLETCPNLEDLRFRQSRHDLYGLLGPKVRSTFDTSSVRTLRITTPSDLPGTLGYALCGIAAGVEDFTLDCGDDTLSARAHEDSELEASLCRVKILRLLQCRTFSTVANPGWLGATGSQLAQYKSIKELHLDYESSTGLAHTIPQDAFTLLPPDIDSLTFTSKASYDASEGTTLLSSLAQVWTHTPNPKRKVGMITARLEMSTWVGKERFRELCRNAGIELELKETEVVRQSRPESHEFITVHWVDA